MAGWIPRRARTLLRPTPTGGRGARTTRVVARILTVLLLVLVAAAGWVGRAPVDRSAPSLIVNDVTQLNPILVDEVIAPTTTEEIVEAVRRHPGPVAVGGGRYSMGGQTATAGALHLDMRQFNQIVTFSPVARLITVQAGARWRQIQERIDPADLAAAIMQTYGDFTVGGSLSVNVHGRYVGLGPLVMSVRSLEVVLADGSLVQASRTENADIFYGVIGGYGGLGVITEATLELAENVKIKRDDRIVSVGGYRQYFFDTVRGSPTAVFHNGDISPRTYDTVHTVTYSTTDDPLTVEDRLIPEDTSYHLRRVLWWVMSEWPFGVAAREFVFEPLLYLGAPVT